MNRAVSTKLKPDNDNEENARDGLVKLSKELVVGLVGYAGAGCSSYAKSIELALLKNGYQPNTIKLSKFIKETSDELTSFNPPSGLDKGIAILDHAHKCQDVGDKLRSEKGGFYLASKAISEIQDLRGEHKIGEEKIAYILDSIKNEAEIQLLREVYGSSFRLIAVHCSPEKRWKRLFGPEDGAQKFAGAPEKKVEEFMRRDEMDGSSVSGQQVRKVFHLADYFLNGDSDIHIPLEENDELQRFIELLLGNGFHRPKPSETAMYAAFSAALRSSCLSRQVGAALISPNGGLIAIGSNDVPKYGGGTYLEDANPDNRCAHWVWNADGTGDFVGCHNQRNKNLIVEELRNSVSELIGKVIEDNEKKFDEKKMRELRDVIQDKIDEFKPPKIGDLIEYSRSIHAEMDAVFSAAREGHSTLNTKLFCTTYPCHNCARHLVTAGVTKVYYVEPFTKSHAISLHSDAISQTESRDGSKQTKMEILPFLGVGPRMYEDHFLKNGELKDASGSVKIENNESPIRGIRLEALKAIEDSAASLIG